MSVGLRDRAFGLLKAHLSARSRRQLKGAYRRARAPFRAARRQRLDTLDAGRLATDLGAAGIRPGDILLVHSALSRVGNVEAGARTVIESLMAAVTEEGTLLMPAYGDAQTVLAGLDRGELVDLRVTPALTGKISETFRTWPGVVRSSHPFSSMCAWGAQAEFLTRDHETDPRIAHAASPLGRVVELDGKVVGLGVSLGPVSFYHVIEDTWDGFPFSPYLPPREVSYLDADGRRVTRQIRRYDPAIVRTRIDQPDGAWIRAQMTEHLWRKGLLRRFSFGAASSWVIDARPFAEELKRLAENRVTIYLTEEESAAAPVGTASW